MRWTVISCTGNIGCGGLLSPVRETQDAVDYHLLYVKHRMRWTLISCTGNTGCGGLSSPVQETQDAVNYHLLYLKHWINAVVYHVWEKYDTIDYIETKHRCERRFAVTERSSYQLCLKIRPTAPGAIQSGL